MKRIITFLKKKELYLCVARYILGLVMISYALTKILRTQFAMGAGDIWNQPLESLSGKTIAWSFLGYSSWFEVLIGLFELIPALLLLYRRTTLLGAVLMLPVSLNVVLINYALNLWDETKLLSLFLFALNCIVLILEWRKIGAVIQIIIGKGIKLRFTIAEVVINTAVIIGVVYYAGKPLLEYKSQKDIFMGDWINNHPNEWLLQTEIVDDRVLEHRDLKLYFGTYGHYSEVPNSYMGQSPNYYKVNDTQNQIEFLNADKKITGKYAYTLTGDSILRIEKAIGLDKNIKLIQLYKRRIVNNKLNAD